MGVRVFCVLLMLITACSIADPSIVLLTQSQAMVPFSCDMDYCVLDVRDPPGGRERGGG